jgi:hypothetical protein
MNCPHRGDVEVALKSILWGLGEIKGGVDPYTAEAETPSRAYAPDLMNRSVLKGPNPLLFSFDDPDARWALFSESRRELREGHRGADAYRDRDADLAPYAFMDHPRIAIAAVRAQLERLEREEGFIDGVDLKLGAERS